MQGTHNIGLVALSYLIASLAAFVAIEFASRMQAREIHRAPWLIAGAIAMGTGIWSMHFIGMTAFTLPVAISYDGAITFLSWVAAVGVSALALYLVGYGKLNRWTLVAGALVMGGGICVMHYGGMWAMRMTPVIVYRPLLFATSVAIAIVASGAALLIIASLREMRGVRDVFLRVAAALIMGLAVAGMHYTGMAAAEFANGAMCAPGNQLSADILPVPIAIATLLILGFGIAFALMDARDLARARGAARKLDQRVQSLAFADQETGLPNRARLTQLVVDRMRAQRVEGFALTTLRIEGKDGSAPSGELMCAIRDRIERSVPGATIARTQPEHLVVMLDGAADYVELRCEALFALIRRDLPQLGGYTLTSNMAHYPTDADNAQALMLRAVPKTTYQNLPLPRATPLGRIQMV